MTNLDMYLDTRRKFEPLESLNYTITEQERTHSELMKGFSSSNHELLYSVIRAARSLDYYVKALPEIRALNPDSKIILYLEDQHDIMKEYIAIFVGEDVVDQFIEEIS